MTTRTDTLSLTRPNSLAIVLMMLGNLIPLVGVIWWGWTVASVLVLYWVETVIIGLMNVPRIMATKDGFGIKVFISLFFMVHFGGFCWGHAFFLKQSFNAGPEFDALLNFRAELSPLVISAAAFFASHLFGLIRSFFGPVKYKDRDANLQMFTPYGRIIIMQFTVLLGGGLVMMLGSPLAAIIILILLKTWLDWIGLKLAEKYTLLL